MRRAAAAPSGIRDSELWVGEMQMAAEPHRACHSWGSPLPPPLQPTPHGGLTISPTCSGVFFLLSAQRISFLCKTGHHLLSSQESALI